MEKNMSRSDRIKTFLVKLGTVTLFAISTLLFICILEFFSWATMSILDKLHSPYFMLTYSDDIIQRLYNTNEPKSYKEMLAETWNNKHRVLKYEPFVEYTEKEYNGKYIKVSKEGYRYIKNQETSFIDNNKINIFVFGGSTTFGYGVKNEETIPSYIQEILKTKYGKTNIAVYNFGVASYYSSIERIKFENFLASGYKPDIVIFIDGLNDFYHYKVPSKTGVSDRIETAMLTQLGGGGLKEEWLSTIKNIIQHSQTIKLIKRIAIPSGYNEIKNEKELEAKCMANDQDLSKTAYRLSMNRLMIKGICDKTSIIPIFVQQPVPVYHFNNATRVVPVPLDLIDKQINAKNGYKIMVEQYKKKSFLDDNMLWLEDLTISNNQYVDTVHYSPQYNYAIAEKIAADINNKLLKK